MARSKVYTFDNVQYTITENRAKPYRYDDAIIQDPDDERLITVERGRKLHWAAVDDWKQMKAAAKEAGYTLLINNGWRERPWKTKEEYEYYTTKELVDKPGGKKGPRYGSIAVAKKRLGYASAHHIGLAIDLGFPFNPTFGTNNEKQKAQRLLPEFKWMVQNAARFGWTPLLNAPGDDDSWPDEEPWHWEHYVPKSVFFSTPSDEAKKSLQNRRAGAYAGGNRRGIWQSSNNAWELIQNAAKNNPPPLKGEFIKESIDTTGLLYDFQNGYWL